MTDTKYYITKKRVDWKNIINLCVFGLVMYFLIGAFIFCLLDIDSVYSYHERIIIAITSIFAFYIVLYCFLDDLSMNLIEEKKIFVKSEKVKK